MHPYHCQGWQRGHSQQRRLLGGSRDGLRSFQSTLGFMWTPQGKCEKSCPQVQSLQGIVTSRGCGLPVRVKPCTCSLDLGPWLCRSPSVQLAEVQDNFLSSEECEFLKAQVHFDVRGSGGSPKRCKGPKGPLEASTIQKQKKNRLAGFFHRKHEDATCSFLCGEWWGVQRHSTDVEAGEKARQPDNSWKVCPQTRAAKVATIYDI